jgi:hypothetical protein
MPAKDNYSRKHPAAGANSNPARLCRTRVARAANTAVVTPVHIDLRRRRTRHSSFIPPSCHARRSAAREGGGVKIRTDSPSAEVSLPTAPAFVAASAAQRPPDRGGDGGLKGHGRWREVEIASEHAHEAIEWDRSEERLQA